MERPLTATTDAPQWVPTEDDVNGARVTDFARFAERRTGGDYPDYRALWQWSVDDIEGFWSTLWDYFDLGERGSTVLESAEMPGARWFPKTSCNYVDQIVRNARTDRPAILHVGEDGQVAEMSWRELLGRAAAFAKTLRSHGVTTGDRVVGYLPNIPEAIIQKLQPYIQV